LKYLFRNFIKADTDNVKVTSEPAYDSTNDWKKVSVENDNVGLAKSTDVSADQPRHITNAYDSTNDVFKVNAQQVANPPNLDMALTALKDALLDNVKGAYRLGVEDLTLASTDPEITVPSGVEADFMNIQLNNKYFNYGTTRCHSVCVLKSGGKLKLGANSVFRFVR